MATATKRGNQRATQQDQPQGQSAQISSPQSQTISGEQNRQTQSEAQPTRYQITNKGRRNQAQTAKNEQLARALGWFSLGLGAVEVAAPRGLARLIGVNNHPLLFRTLGLREIASGVGILVGGRQPSTAVWSRVAGDAMDLALLGAALATSRSKGRAAAATAAVLGVAALDYYCAQQLSQADVAPDGKVEVKRFITIGKSADELYQIWRQPDTLPQIMRHFADVTTTSDREAHWKINASVSSNIEWNTRITEDRPGEFVAWESLEGAKLPNDGSVSFRPATGNRGTEVTLRFRFVPIGGALGIPLAKAFEPIHEKFVGQALRSFKSLVETGEIPTLSRNPSARGKGDAV